jgi:hypothetical protein
MENYRYWEKGAFFKLHVFMKLVDHSRKIRRKKIVDIFNRQAHFRAHYSTILNFFPTPYRLQFGINPKSNFFLWYKKD